MKGSRFIAVNGLLSAIIVLFILVPISIGPVKLAVLPLLAVIIGAQFAGLKSGLFLGLFFGLVSLSSAFMRPDVLSQAFYNPLVSVVPRVMIGLVVYFVTKGLKQLLKGKKQYIAYTVGAAAGVITNTTLVLGVIMLFHFNETFTYASVSLTVGWQWIAAILSMNFLIELAIAIILTPPIILALKKAVK